MATSSKKRNSDVVILSPAQMALVVSKTGRQLKSIDNSAFKTSDAEGVNNIKVLTLFVGKTKSASLVSEVVLLLGNIVEDDIKDLPDYAVRWNAKERCAELNVRRYIGKVGGPKIPPKERYPADESFYTWIKLIPGTVISITDWNKSINADMEFSVAKIINLFAVSTDPNKPRNEYWVPYTMRFGNLAPLVRAPANRDMLRDVLKMLPYKLFRTPSPRELFQMNQNDSVVQFLHTIPGPAVNPKIATEAMSQALWTYAVSRREPGHAAWCFDERVKGQTGPPAPAAGAPKADVVFTSATVPLTKKKRASFVGTIQQKDDATSADFASFCFTMTAWPELVEATFATYAVDNWLAIKDYVTFANGYWLVKINLQRTKNAVSNAAYTGEDGEEPEEHHRDCYAIEGTVPLEPAKPAAAAAAAAPAAGGEEEDEDYATLVKNTQASAQAAQVAPEQFDGTINMTALRSFLDLPAFIRSVGFKVSAKFTKKSVIGPDGTKQLRNIFSRITDFKPRGQPSVPETLAPVTCVSDYHVDYHEPFCKLVNENKGEFYMLVETLLEENQIARIADLTIAESEAVLDDSPKAPFRINKTIPNPRYVLYYIHNIKNEKKLAAERDSLTKLTAAIKEKILIPDLDDDEEAAIAAAEKAAMDDAGAAAPNGGAAAAAPEAMDTSAKNDSAAEPAAGRRSKKARTNEAAAAADADPFNEAAGGEQAATGSGAEGDEALKRMSAATKAKKNRKAAAAAADE